MIAHLLIAAVFAVMRIMGHKSHRFQAFAHLYCGFLIAAAWYQWRVWPEATLLVTLSVVEVACFIWFHFHPHHESK